MDTELKKIRENTSEALHYFTEIMAYTLGPAELKEIMEENDVVILDVRAKQDYDNGHIPKAVSMPRAELETRYTELSKEKQYIVYCYNQQCHLAVCACRFLSLKEYKAMHLDGGYKTWTEDFQFAITKE